MSSSPPSYPVPVDEAERLQDLGAYKVHGTGPEHEYDNVARVAAELFEAPVALVNLVGRDTQWSKARIGFNACELPRGVSFCTHTVMADDVLVVPNALEDPRFAANPLVTGEAHVRFYAGAPLLTPKGRRIGALCVLDTEPRPALTEREGRLLQGLARLVMDHLERRRLETVARAAARMAATTSDAIVCTDGDGRITVWNRAAETVFGHTRKQAIGQTLDLIIPERSRGAHWQGFARLLRGGEPRLLGRSVEVPALHRAGREITVELALSTWREGGAFGVGAIIRDVTARKQAEAEQRHTRRFLDTVLESMPASIFVKDARDYRYLLLNRAAEDLFGVPRHEMLGKDDYGLFSEATADTFRAHARAALRSGEMQFFEQAINTPHKGTRLVSTRKLAIAGENGEPAYLLGFAEDITDRRDAEARVAHMAHHDALTGLANRVLLRERLQQALGMTRRHADGVAVLCLDLDQFKAVNDTLGHPIGDGLLQGAAERLRGCVRQGDTVARLGGDEFAVVRAAPGAPEDIASFARRIVRALAEPFRVADHQIVVSASVGVAIAPTDGTEPDALLRNGDIALYRAKADGGDGYCFFEPGMDARLHARRAMEIDLRQALAASQFELHYQPLTCLGTNAISGVEALLRWRHPTRGLVPPGEFIPLAEAIGLIVPLGEWVLREACAEVARWPGAVKLAVNLSPVQFARGSVVRMVTDALAASGLAPGRLELEITESVLLQDDQMTLATLRGLKALGVRISMDDFGTGYSSLSYLRRFPFDKIKVDQSFVREMAGDAECLAIVRAIVDLGTTLGMTTTAEGVETDEQLALLRTVGCDEAQGFLFSRPKPASEIVRAGLRDRPALARAV